MRAIPCTVVRTSHYRLSWPLCSMWMSHRIYFYKRLISVLCASFWRYFHFCCMSNGSRATRQNVHLLYGYKKKTFFSFFWLWGQHYQRLCLYVHYIYIVSIISTRPQHVLPYLLPIRTSTTDPYPWHGIITTLYHSSRGVSMAVPGVFM